MNMKYSNNLMFQKKHLPEIYKSYFVTESEENAEYKINAKKKKYLYFYVEAELGIVQFIEKMFCVNVQYSLPLSLCEIKFGYDNTIVYSDSGRVIFEINHPYLDYNKALIISSDVNFGILEESFAFYTYNSRPFKQLTNLKIKRCCEYEYESHDLKSRDEFLRCVSGLEPAYTFSVSVASSKRERFIQSSFQVEEVSLIVIRTINESIALKEDEILNLCRNRVLELLTIKSIEILSRYLKMGMFANNFIIVEQFFDFERNFSKELEKYFKDKIFISIRNFARINNDYAIRYNAISGDESILKLNSFMEMHLKKFCEVLEDR